MITMSARCWLVAAICISNQSLACDAVFAGRVGSLVDHEGSRAAQLLGGTVVSQIPSHLVLTGKGKSLGEESQAIQDNIKRTLKLDPQLQIRWFDDTACRAFMRKHYDDELVFFFDQEPQGNFRGDICRAAVLAVDGGFYTDLDVQMAVPMHELIDAKTTFAGVYENTYGDNAIWNALIVAAPGDAVMTEAVKEIRRWYNNPLLQTGNMGPTTLGRALQTVAVSRCPENQPHPPSLGAGTEKTALEWGCGSSVMRLYTQDRLHCDGAYSPECSTNRAQSSFEGLRWGVFVPGNERSIVAWSRFEACQGYGCGGNGWKRSEVGCWAGKRHTWLCTTRSELLFAFFFSVGLLILGVCWLVWFVVRTRILTKNPARFDK